VTNRYDWILPAVTSVCWLLSWPAPRSVRWGVLTAGVVLSILCIPVAMFVPTAQPSPDNHCRPLIECSSPDPLYWAMAGVIGFVSCLALIALTLVIEGIAAAARWVFRRRTDRADTIVAEPVEDIRGAGEEGPPADHRG
jgi:hypothetical protein